MKKIIIYSTLSLLLIFIILFFLFPEIFYREPSESITIEYPDHLKIKEIAYDEYSLPVDSFIIYKGTIRKNQTLSLLLNEFNLTNQAIHQIVTSANEVFDVRKIRYGRSYQAYCSKDSSERLFHFVYEHSPVDYLLLSFRDSIHAVRLQKEVHVARTAIGGTVNSSLWQTMTDKGIDPMLAVELSEIYAWSIDFFGLQEGDQYRVIFDQQYVDNQYIGLGKIHAVWFRHMDHDFYAIPFIQDSLESFYDQNGNSLRKAFLKAPLRYSRISSRYSHSRFHPILRIRRPHYGVDYAAPVGTPVHAIGDGKVTETAYKKGSGNMVKIRHNSVYTTAYLHLSRFGKGINPGVYVNQGDVIGYVGSTGLSTGPHLDFRFYKNGYPIDPLKVKAPPVKPVKEELRPKFDLIKTIVMESLDNIEIR